MSLKSWLCELWFLEGFGKVCPVCSEPKHTDGGKLFECYNSDGLTPTRWECRKCGWGMLK